MHCDKVHCGNLVAMFVQPCDNLATVSKYKVMPRLHCGNLVTMFGQPCDNLATVSKYKVVPRLCQGCKKQPYAKAVTTLSFLYGCVLQYYVVSRYLINALLLIINY